ncbi:MAG: phenylalanine--tRNA ligase subunit beta [Candidatus Nanosyncoccaceae bacterium]|jgi:phenylalanyl-tRNA synthetase beta chain
MIVSYNWLKKFTQINLSAEALAKEIGSKLVEVESVESLAPKYAGVKIARVKSAEKIDGSDHLTLCKIDDGGVNKKVKRDDDGLVQVVCGAQNVKADTNIAWIMPGAIVPATYGTDDEFKLDTRKLMGHDSNGMIASARELALYDEHEGILVLDENLELGVDFAKVYELDDYLFDIENKSLTNRPDCFGVIGFAREVATILGQEFKSPDWLVEVPRFTQAKDFKVFIKDKAIASKYQLAMLDNLKSVKGLSLLERTYLARVGVRPISPIVDVTNYLMMLSAQPLHAFDADKVEAICQKQGKNTIEVGVRLARSGEKLTTLDGHTLKLDPSDIVISAGEEAIGLAGAMGGRSTEIDESTQRVLLESASFDLYKLRGTQMRHGIFSEAVTRFTKGQPAALSAPVLAEAGRLMLDSPDFPVATAEQDIEYNQPITVNYKWTNAVLGTDLSQADMVRTLSAAEFEVESAGDDLLVTAPFWRTDIKIPVDVVEEIGRVHGYDNIIATLPQRAAKAVQLSDYDKFLQQLRDMLSSAGANEVLTYSFISNDLAKKAGQDPDNSYKIVNSISPELQLCRQTLQPSLLNLIHANIKAGFDKFALYEINRIQQKSDGLTDEKVPVENQNLGLVVAKKQSEDTAYYLAKKYLNFVLRRLGVLAQFKPLSEKNAINVPFEPKRSAEIIINGKIVGVIGEYKNSTTKNFKLPRFAAGFEVDLMELFELVQKASVAENISLAKFPSVERAICFESKTDLIFAELETALQSAALQQKYDIKYRPIDIFIDDKKTFKRTTFELSISDSTKTLTSNEANVIIDAISEMVKKELGIEIV